MARLSWMVGNGDPEPCFAGCEPNFGSPFGDSAPDFSRGVFAAFDALGSWARPADWAENPRPIRIEVAPIKARAAIHDLARMAVRLLPGFVGHPILGTARGPRVVPR